MLHVLIIMGGFSSKPTKTSEVETNNNSAAREMADSVVEWKILPSSLEARYHIIIIIIVVDHRNNQLFLSYGIN